MQPGERKKRQNRRRGNGGDGKPCGATACGSRGIRRIYIRRLWRNVSAAARRTLFPLSGRSSAEAAAGSFIPECIPRNTATTTAPGRDSGGTSGSGGWKSGGMPCARPAAAFSRPNAPTLPIAATPVAKRHTGRALRAMVSDQNDLSARIVTASKKQSGSRKRVLIR